MLLVTIIRQTTPMSKPGDAMPKPIIYFPFHSGHFMYTEASGKPAGYHAKLESPVFQDLDGRDSISNCLSFYYNMYGLGMGQLNIYLVFIDGRHELLWKTSGNHGKAWHHGIFTFTSFSTYKVR